MFIRHPPVTTSSSWIYQCIYRWYQLCQSFSKAVWSSYILLNRDFKFCTIRGGLEVRQLAAILSVSDRLIAKRLTEIFQFLSKSRLCLSAHDPPKTWNCTNQRNHKQNSEDFSFSCRWPWAYFWNGPNAAASTAPTLIRHWTRWSQYHTSPPEAKLKNKSISSEDPVWVLVHKSSLKRVKQLKKNVKSHVFWILKK